MNYTILRTAAAATTTTTTIIIITTTKTKAFFFLERLFGKEFHHIVEVLSLFIFKSSDRFVKKVDRAPTPRWYPTSLAADVFAQGNHTVTMHGFILFSLFKSVEKTHFSLQFAQSLFKYCGDERFNT